MDEHQEIVESEAVDSNDEDKNLPIHFAAAKGMTEDVLKEIESGEKIDAENYLGWTPLMMATRNGHVNTIRTLLDKGADATKRNKFRLSIFIISIASGDLSIIDLILQHLLCGGVSRKSMQDILSPLSAGILFKRNHLLNYLIEQSFDVNISTPKTGLTPLMFAAALDNCDAFSALKDSSANLNLKNYNGHTAYDIADSKKRPIQLNVEGKKNKQLCPEGIPFIIFSPIFQVPVAYDQPYLNQNVIYDHVRKSSENVFTPNYYFPPNVTPVACNELTTPQMFFPPTFSPSELNHAFMNKMFHPNDLHNTRIYNNGIMPPFPSYS